MTAYKESKTSPCCVVRSAQEEKPVSCGKVYVDDDCVEEASQLYTSIAFKPECLHQVAHQPMISLKIGKSECCAILDTGAEASLISAAVLKENDWKLQIDPHPTMELMGITGKKDLVSSFAVLQYNLSESS